MTTENGIGIQTRAVTEAQCMDDGAQRLNPVMNPTVDLHKTDDEVIKEFVRRHAAIGLDWYVPNFSNTRVGD